MWAPATPGCAASPRLPRVPRSRVAPGSSSAATRVGLRTVPHQLGASLRAFNPPRGLSAHSRRSRPGWAACPSSGRQRGLWLLRGFRVPRPRCASLWGGSEPRGAPPRPLLRGPPQPRGARRLLRLRFGFLGQSSSGREQDLRRFGGSRCPWERWELSGRPVAFEVPSSALGLCPAQPQGAGKGREGMGKGPCPAGGNAPAHAALQQRVTTRVCSFRWLSGLGRHPVLPFLSI